MNFFLNFDQWFKRKCCLKIFLIWSSDSPFVQWSETIFVILLDGIMKNNSVKLFEFRPVVMEEMLFKYITCLQLWQPFYSAEQNHLCTSGRVWNNCVK